MSHLFILRPGKINSLQKEAKAEEDEKYTLPHPIWSKEEVDSVQIHHTPPVTTVDKVRRSVGGRSLVGSHTCVINMKIYEQVKQIRYF